MYIFKGSLVEYIFIFKGLRLLRLCQVFHDGTCCLLYGEIWTRILTQVVLLVQIVAQL
jgi:hypothetical protein